MLLNKTEKARAALLDRTTDQSLLDRRALILSDGKRSLNDLAVLLGADAVPAIERLLRDGYLAGSHATAAADPNSTISALAGVFNAVRAQASARQAPPPVPPQPAAAVPAPGPAPPPSRRSLVSARMYLSDMLQLQRNAQSAALTALIQASKDPDELLGHMLRALRHLVSVSSASYGRRVIDRLAEIIPEEYLPALTELRAQLPDSAPA
ncbi:MAG: hypothetical protein ACYC42_07120 [Lysobacter sp.]